MSTQELCKSQDCILGTICIQAEAIRKINPLRGSGAEVIAQVRYAKDKAAQRRCPNQEEIKIQAGTIIQAMRRASSHR